ncbi:MAG: hypothetical protein IKR76_04185 [Ruminococcus sp.]|nr:hypothetical protein [Ruminococcus sp.]
MTPSARRRPYKTIYHIYSLRHSTISFASFPVSAQILEQCYHCNATGKFNCTACGNKGKIVCGECNGKGQIVCPGEEGRGKCDGGYYQCPSCRGDGKEHDDHDDIVSDTCPNCKGTGKMRN